MSQTVISYWCRLAAQLEMRINSKDCGYVE